MKNESNQPFGSTTQQLKGKRFGWVWVLGIPVTVSAAFVGFKWYQGRDVKLSERPEQSASTSPIEPHVSTIVASISVSHDTLKQALNKVGNSVAGSQKGSEDLKCVKSKFPKIKECLTAKWDVSYKPGTITVAKTGDFVKVTVPVSFNGGAGFGGGIASALSVGRKKIDGAAVVSASLSAQLDERFCPVLTVRDTEFAWTHEARVQVIGRTKVFNVFNIGPIYLDVGRHFNGPFREALRRAADDAGRAIPCDQVRAEIAKLWRRYSVPIVREGQPPLYVNVSPERLGSSGLLSEDKGIRIALMLSARAVVETSAGAATPLGELPAHVSLQPQAGQLNLAVPVRLEYDKLTSTLKAALLSHTFEKDTPAGKITLQLENFDIFPSGNRIAVGIQFKADLPKQIFDTTGTVWLVAQPLVDSSGKSIGLSKVAIHRRVDNQAVNVLTAIFEEQINEAIEKAAKYDLRKDEQTVIEALQKAISDPTKTSGVKLAVTDPSIRFGRVGVEDKALTIEGLFSAIWSAEVLELRL